MAKIIYINYLQEKMNLLMTCRYSIIEFIFPNFSLMRFLKMLMISIQVKNNMENLPIYDNDIHTFLFIYKGEIYEPIIYLDLSTKSIARYTDFTYNNLIKYLETDFTVSFIINTSERI